MRRIGWKPLCAVVILALAAAVLWRLHPVRKPASLLALDSRTGRQLWQSQLDALGFYGVREEAANLKVAAFVEFGRCRFGARNFTIASSSGRLIDTGAQIKNQQPGRHVDDGDMRYSVASSEQDPGTGTFGVMATDTSTGAVRWRSVVSAPDVPGLSAGSGVVVLTELDQPGFTVLDETTGSTLWKSTAGDVSAVAGGSDDDRVYVLTRHHVDARDSRTGVSRWQATPKGDPVVGRVGPVVSSTREFVAVGQGTRLAVYDHEGHRLYAKELPAAPDIYLFMRARTMYVGLGGHPSSRHCD